MADERQLIADNIAFLRKSVKLTQAELAEKLNYSDKAVSKWERAESIPDVLVLRRIASLFSVSLDFFFEEHDVAAEKPQIEVEKQKMRAAVTLTACVSVAVVAILVYVILRFALPNADFHWKVFVAALPVLSLVYLVLQALWGRNRIFVFVAISAFLWSVFGTAVAFLQGDHLPFDAAELFWVCIPIQVIVLVWAFFVLRKRKKIL